MADIDKLQWNSFVDANKGTVFHSYEWLYSYEKSAPHKGKTLHQVLYDDNENILALFPVFLIQECPRLKAMRTILVKQPTTITEPILMSHSLYAYYGYPLVSENNTELYEIILSRYQELSTTENIAVYGFFGVPEDMSDFIKLLKQRYFTTTYLSSTATIKIVWDCYEDYLNSLSKKMRHRVRWMEGKYNSSGFYFKTSIGSKEDLFSLVELDKTVLKKHNHKDTNLFPIEYLREILDQFNEKLLIVSIMNNNNELVSANLCFIYNNSLIPWIAGIDYSKLGIVSYHYFYVWAIKYAIENKYQYVDLGRGSHDLKMCYGYKCNKTLLCINTTNNLLKEEASRWANDYAEVSLQRFNETLMRNRKDDSNHG